ncbi:MAG: CBS domain-containing protein [Rhizorhabdus sp.]|nr:MAG: CBS domain-containing protein [Rhizorhabdus sp.]
MTIATILQGRGDNPIISISPGMAVVEVVALLADKRIGAVPVIEQEQVIGIMSERDMIYGLRKDGAKFLDREVRDVMTAPVITVTSDTSPLEALAMMTRRRIRHLPVVDDGVLIGFVSIGDLVKARMERIEGEAAAMREYIQTA